MIATNGHTPRNADASAVDPDLFDELKNQLKRVKIDEDDTEYWRVESDYLMDEDQLFIYSQQRAAANAQQKANALAEASPSGNILTPIGDNEQSLVGILQHGKIIRWNAGTVLTYCVLRRTFPKQAWYDETVATMKQATADWQATCGISFSHRADLDSSEGVRPQGVVFPVRFIDAGGQFIAAAFFPHDPPDRRRVLIDPSYFSTNFDHVGVLRHELGHVLGFRHEHIQSGAPPICPDEDKTDTFDLTNYDPRSVMHYFCGGAGRRELTISDSDRSGSQSVYGPPLSNFDLMDP
ncbi:zinc metalloprotease [Rhodococcus opacus]|uniref:hypothetical protein n=1 Tax=Rhodococcus opacus TaxID=37919 RepID=UPI002955CD29|nr:hypothetical protein [Rhodococcus opacus]MDV7088654.1 hypothetical protein [Rhodococcus opacus]